MIKTFPIFEKLTLDHQQEIKSCVHKFSPYSDFNFTSLWTYNTEDKAEISILNNNLIVKFYDYIDRTPFYTFIGKKKVVETTKRLIDFAIKKGINPVLNLVPEVVVRADKSIRKIFQVKEDINNYDYILDVKEIATLKGKKYYDKRNLVNRFNKKYPQCQIVDLDLDEASIKKQMVRVFRRWEKRGNKKRTETQVELLALKRLLTHSRILKVRSVGIYDRKKLIGFATYDFAHNHYGFINFEKADRNYDGIYAILNQYVAIRMNEAGCHYINYEQDLGIDNLRKAKLLWRPVFYLKKYIIQPK